MATAPDIRSVIVDILARMGEIEPDTADELRSDSGRDLPLVQLNFDSLAMLDFCLQVETAVGAVINPDELLQLHSLRELEAELIRRLPATSAGP
jgi:acyl carrier protein